MLFVIEVIYNKVNFFENSWVFIRYLSDEPIYALIFDHIFHNFTDIITFPFAPS